MKTRFFLTATSGLSRFFILFMFLGFSNASFSQMVPELQFLTVSLVSGNAGEDGATYRFANVAPGIDAEVEIKGRSSVAVVLGSIDTSGPGLGYPKAFQPVVGIPGVAPANTSWSMDFEMTFYRAGTNARQNISEFFASGIDIDGDGGNLFEWANMNKVNRIDTTLVNNLNITRMAAGGDGDDYSVRGIVANAVGIDTNAANVMANYRFVNKNFIRFTIGASTIGSTTTAAMRLNSIWFKQFNNPALPVKLVDFTAGLKVRQVALKWVTTAEVNVSHFEVEKSHDGNNYTTTGIVFATDKAEGLNQYSLTDQLNQQETGVIYYRLRSVDKDGKFQLSETRMIQAGQDNRLTLQTYPNPVKESIQVTIPQSWQNQPVKIEVYAANGRMIVQKNSNGNNQTESLNLSTLSPGFYIVKASAAGQTAQQKIIKH